MVIQTKITEMFGIKHPVFSAPMGPFYTTDLTIAVSEAGGLGTLSHTNLGGKSSIDVMKKNMETVVEHTDKPFGFNIRTSRMQMDARTLCRKIPDFIRKNQKIRNQCLYAVTSAGTAKMLPQSRSFQKLKEESDIKHFHVAPALWLADKCVEANVDGLVITGTEGGGHQSYEKVSTLVLLQQIEEKYPDVPVIACGGFATGEGLAAALSLGADAIAMGTRFIASKDCEFHDDYKGIIPPASALDTVLTTGVFGPIRLWTNRYAKTQDLVGSKEEKKEIEATLEMDDLEEINRKYELAYEGNIEDGAVLVGQTMGLIDGIRSVSDLMEEIVSDAEKYLKRANNLIK
ncbi:MAG: nitronate monooxygenase [Promethearchaeota archaeon]|nr:MAG: nitronate monooxygenase [Candidatus Lokiarchaeota archaeon]